MTSNMRYDEKMHYGIITSEGLPSLIALLCLFFSQVQCLPPAILGDRFNHAGVLRLTGDRRSRLPRIPKINVSVAKIDVGNLRKNV